jgi:tryptophan-rich sensory protein
MKIQWKKLIVAVAIPLLVGGLSALLTSGQMEAFGNLNQPFLSPPAWLFPVVWTILYVLMGVASYRIWIASATDEKKKSALFVYGLQLVFNFFWSIIFFNLKLYLFAFLWLVVLWVLIYITYKRFGKIDVVAEYLLIPYLVWVAFAGYLNLAIWILN